MTLADELVEVLNETDSIEKPEDKLKFIHEKLGNKYTEKEINDGINILYTVLRRSGYK
jgi:hypothetical protein